MATSLAGETLTPPTNEAIDPNLIYRIDITLKPKDMNTNISPYIIARKINGYDLLTLSLNNVGLSSFVHDAVNKLVIDSFDSSQPNCKVQNLANSGYTTSYTVLPTKRESIPLPE